jgi:hypothetical protein
MPDKRLALMSVISPPWLPNRDRATNSDECSLSDVIYFHLGVTARDTEVGSLGGSIFAPRARAVERLGLR